LIIDADEELLTIPKDPAEFSSRLAMIPAGVGALALTVREKGNGTEWVGTRFFRRSTFRGYKGIVHNKSDYDGDCAGSDMLLMHYGYSLSPDKLIAKQQRSEALLRTRLENDPNDYIAMFYLQQICAVQNRCEEAVVLGRRCLELYEPDYQGDMQYLHGVYYMQGVSYMKLRDGDSAYAWAAKGLERRPDDIDLNYLMARIGYESMNHALMAKHGQKYLELYDAHGLDLDSKGTFENPFDGGRFSKNVTVFTRRPDTREQVDGWVTDLMREAE
jgi:tetratricopeptide (TPR) repeat protein